MFTLDSNQFREFDLRRARQFIDFWSKFYRSDTTKAFHSDEVIDYFKELNLGNRLTEQNVKRLLRWKDPRMLTEEKLSGLNKGEKNEKVMKVIGKLSKINGFRNALLAFGQFLRSYDKK